MTHAVSIIRTGLGCASVLVLAGCLAPPKRHAWQIPREDLPRVQGAESWSQLSTNAYVRVPDSAREDAVALLHDHAWIPLDASQLSVFVQDLPIGTARDAHPYLVRGVSFSSHPAYTIVRFDAATGRLLVQQFTYDGEMVNLFRSVAEPNAFVVFLPRAPDHIYPDAVLGGDGIFRGTKWNAMDRR